MPASWEEDKIGQLALERAVAEEAFFEVIARAVVEEVFRARLLAEPGSALEGYDLASEEREALAGAASEPLDESVPLQTIPQGRCRALTLMRWPSRQLGS